MGSQKAPTVTQTSQIQLSPEQKQLFETAFPYAQQYASTPIQQYQGTGIAGFTAPEQQAQDQYLTQAAPQAGALASQAAAAQSKMLDPNFMLDVANNPYLRAANEATTGQVTQNLNENILPGLRAGATQAGGMYSSASSKSGIAEGQAVGRTNQGLSDTIAKTMMDAYNSGRTGMQGAIAGNGAVQAQQLIAPDITAAVGGQQRAMDQAQLDEQIKKFYTGQQLPLQQAQELMGLVSGMPGATTSSTATGSVPQANPLMQGGGILASLLGLL